MISFLLAIPVLLFAMTTQRRAVAMGLCVLAGALMRGGLT